MSKYEVSNSASGHSFGVVEADSTEAAIEAVCRDAGYDSKAAAEAAMGRDTELVAIELPAVSLQYPVPTIDGAWAASRETHIAVATAIHAISDSSRSADDIWAEPTAAEWDHVCMAVENYVSAGAFAAEDDGRYPWGAEAVVLK